MTSASPNRLQTLRSDKLTDLQARWGVDGTVLSEALREAFQAEKHDEVWTLANALGLDEACVGSGVAQHLARSHPEEFGPVVQAIRALLQ